MGLATAKITLANPLLDSLKPLELAALADTDATFLSLPRSIANQLQLETLTDKEVTSTGGSMMCCPYVGPVQIRFSDRTCFTGAIIVEGDVRMGSIPMDDMGLVVLPLENRVIVNPLDSCCVAGLYGEITDEDIDAMSIQSFQRLDTEERALAK